MTKGNQQQNFGMRLLVGSATLVLAVVAAAAMLGSRSVGAAPQSAPTVKLRTLYQFQGASSGDGAVPGAGVIVDEQGNLYGTTEYGGTATCDTGSLAGCGTMFKVDPTGKETFVFSFDGTNGFYPQGSLIKDASGNLYGTTADGGGNGFPDGPGNVFKIDKKGQETVLYAFTGYPDDGSAPGAGVTFDADGNLYGTTSEGGANCGSCGTVFEVDRAGKETVLYTFTDGASGHSPTSRLIRDAQVNLYGTTLRGAGAGDCGTVFKLDTVGNLTVLHTFEGNPDGCNPSRGVIPDAAGNLYGTTDNGGSSPECSHGCGVVYKLDPTGKETILHMFTPGGEDEDGSTPYAPPTLGRDGNLYGTTFEGGGSSNCSPAYNGCGTVYKIDKNGNETILYHFTGGADGAIPLGWLVPDGKGHVFGTASAGGNTSECSGNHNRASGCGTVFEITP